MSSYHSGYVWALVRARQWFALRRWLRVKLGMRKDGWS